MSDYKKILSAKLEQIIRLDDSALSKMMNLFEVKHFDKGFHYAKTGEYSTRMGFVVEGILRAYHCTKEGEHYNKTFFTEGSFVGAYSSLVTGERNLINIQCLTDVTLLEGSYADLVALYDNYPPIERFSRILAEQYFVHKKNERYNWSPSMRRSGMSSSAKIIPALNSAPLNITLPPILALPLPN